MILQALALPVAVGLASVALLLLLPAGWAIVRESHGAAQWRERLGKWRVPLGAVALLACFAIPFAV